MKLAYLFPGQGSQSVGMGASLYAHNKAAATVLDDVDSILAFKLTTLCFYGPEEKLKETNITQPALYAVSVAALRAIQNAGIIAQAAAGHSVGEYAALVASGALDMQTGLTLVAQRGELMRQAAAAHPGAMAAVLGLPGADVAAVCTEVTDSGAYVAAANFNGAGQVVISGEAEGVAKVSEALKAKGARKVLPLPVSGAFHSRLMQPAVHNMRGFLEHAPFTKATIPIISNVTADYVSDPDAIRENLALQIASPVRWEETIERLVADGFDTFVELGSGKVLTNLVKRIAKDVAAHHVEDAATLEATVQALSGQ